MRYLNPDELPDELKGTWAAPKELYVSVDGIELARGDIVGYRVDGGIARCSNDECIGCIEDEVMMLVFKLPPPTEVVL